MGYTIPAPPVGDLTANEHQLTQAALHWREITLGIPVNAPMDRRSKDELVDAYLAMS
jgi:hypothetical protein